MTTQEKLVASIHNILDILYKLHVNEVEVGYKCYDKFNSLLKDRKIYREEYLCTLLLSMANDFRVRNISVSHATYVRSRPESALERNPSKVMVGSILVIAHKLMNEHAEIGIKYLLELGTIIEGRHVHSVGYCVEALDDLKLRLHLEAAMLKDSD